MALALVDYDASSDEDMDGVEQQQPQASQVQQESSVLLPDPAQELAGTAVGNGSSSRKRSSRELEANGRRPPSPRQKASHSGLRSSVGLPPPDTAGGRLIPPQLLQRRKNVATEDLDKLFVRTRRPQPQPQPGGAQQQGQP